MAAAYLDSQLEELLRKAFVSDANASEQLLPQSRPLGTFSARIDIAYALGLLPSAVYRDLHLIRKIRNDFGHVATPLAFTETAIANRCRELQMPLVPANAPPRQRFTNATAGILAVIHARGFKTTHAVVPANMSEQQREAIRKATEEAKAKLLGEDNGKKEA